MWLTYFDWFIAILSIVIWIGTYIIYEREAFIRWFDNKFGKDDPMPPMPKQQNSPLDIGEGSTFNYKKSSEADQPKE